MNKTYKIEVDCANCAEKMQEADGSKTFTKYVSNQTELPENYRPTSPDEVNWGKKSDLNKLSLEDRSGYSWHALFESDADEAFYGLGMEDNDEENAYCIINKDLEIIVPFQPMDDVKEMLKKYEK